MNRAIRALLVSLLFSVPAQAGPKRLLHDWRLYVGESMMAASMTADGYSTCRNMEYGYPEGNPLARGSLSCGATIGRLAAGFAFYTTLNVIEQKLFRNDRNKVIRSLTPWMVPAAVIPIHSQAAGHNFGLPLPKR